MNSGRAVLPALLFLVAFVAPCRAADTAEFRDLLPQSGDFNSQPGTRIVPHVVFQAPGGCQSPIDICTNSSPEFNVSVPLPGSEPVNAWIYILVTGLEDQHGFAGVQFGIDYDSRPETGVDVLTWTPCSVLEFPMENWPAAGTGNLMTWFPDHPDAPEPCRRTGTVVAGVFEVRIYGNDTFDVTARSADGYLKVADCGGAETWLDHAAAGAVSFGATGDDPCSRPAPPVLVPPEVPVERAWEGPRLILHAVPAESLESGPACPQAPDISCSRDERTLRTWVPLTGTGSGDQWIYVYATGHYLEFHGAVLCLDYSGVSVLEWFNCAPNSAFYSPFPASGFCGYLAWTNSTCQPTPTSLLMAFKVRPNGSGYFGFSTAELRYCPSGGDQPREFLRGLDRITRIGFGLNGGHDTCYEETGFAAPTPATPATWGRIKSLYR